VNAKVWSALLLLLLAVPVAGLMAPRSFASAPEPSSSAAASSSPAASSAPVAPKRPGPRHYQRPSLDERAANLSKVLGLNETQQSELREVLASQREQFRKLVIDPSVPAAYRIGRIRAINDKTEERIRGLLNDEQKKIYLQPRPRDAPEPAQQTGLDDGLNAPGRK
jgi:hypothetical protein